VIVDNKDSYQRRALAWLDEMSTSIAIEKSHTGESVWAHLPI
jgi:hypothetical protein